MIPPYADPGDDGTTREVAVVPAAIPADAPVDWTPAVPPGPPERPGTVGEAARRAGWQRPSPEPPVAEPAPVERQQAPERKPEQPAGEPSTSRRWTEAEVLRFGATIGAIACSIALMVSLGLFLPSVPFLPYLVGTLFYGALAAGTWRAHQAAEDAARVRAENAARSRFRAVEPVDRDGRWSA